MRLPDEPPWGRGNADNSVDVASHIHHVSVALGAQPFYDNPWSIPAPDADLPVPIDPENQSESAAIEDQLNEILAALCAASLDDLEHELRLHDAPFAVMRVVQSRPVLRPLPLKRFLPVTSAEIRGMSQDEILDLQKSMVQEVVTNSMTFDRPEWSRAVKRAAYLMDVLAQPPYSIERWTRGTYSLPDGVEAGEAPLDKFSDQDFVRSVILAGVKFGLIVSADVLNAVQEKVCAIEPGITAQALTEKAEKSVGIAMAQSFVPKRAEAAMRKSMSRGRKGERRVRGVMHPDNLIYEKGRAGVLMAKPLNLPHVVDHETEKDGLERPRLVENPGRTIADVVAEQAPGTKRSGCPARSAANKEAPPYTMVLWQMQVDVWAERWADLLPNHAVESPPLSSEDLSNVMEVELLNIPSTIEVSVKSTRTDSRSLDAPAAVLNALRFEVSDNGRAVSIRGNGPIDFEALGEGRARLEVKLPFVSGLRSQRVADLTATSIRNTLDVDVPAGGRFRAYDIPSYAKVTARPASRSFIAGEKAEGLEITAEGCNKLDAKVGVLLFSSDEAAEPHERPLPMSAYPSPPTKRQRRVQTLKSMVGIKTPPPPLPVPRVERHGVTTREGRVDIAYRDAGNERRWVGINEIDPDVRELLVGETTALMRAGFAVHQTPLASLVGGGQGQRLMLPHPVTRDSLANVSLT